MERTQSFKFMLTALLAAIGMTLTGVSQVFGQPSHARIGVLTPGLTFASIYEGLQEGLARLGYKEGENITFVVEDTQGSSVDLAPRVAKLLAAKPDTLFTVTTIHTLAAKRATTTVPIVFAWASDPVAAGLIASYASSKNNLTGVTNLDASLSGKRLEVFLELAPKVKRLLVLVASILAFSGLGILRRPRRSLEFNWSAGSWRTGRKSSEPSGISPKDRLTRSITSPRL